MNREREHYLAEKYYEGRTTLEEEKELMEYAKFSDEKNSWFNYVDSAKKEIPSNLAEELWNQSEIKKTSSFKKRIFPAIILCAITLMIGSFTYFQIQKKEAYNIKKQQLEEAIQFANNGTGIQTEEVFYRDDLITIYFTY